MRLWKIKPIIHADGDWFRLQFESAEGKKWVTVTRVCFWAVSQIENPTDHHEMPDDYAEGIDSGRYGRPDDDDIRNMYVKGEDLAPNGKSWLAVFNETPVSGMPFSKEVADSVYVK